MRTRYDLFFAILLLGTSAGAGGLEGATPAEEPCDQIRRHLQTEEPAKGDSAGRRVDFLIATLPDPRDPRLAYLFDRHFDALLIALGTKGWVPDRERPLLRGGSRESGPRFGYVLLRPANPDTKTGTASSWLLVFLVPEKPTSGVERTTLAAALDCGCLLAPISPPIRILGPTFSGSADSLGTSLRDWSSHRDWVMALEKAKKNAFRVVSGSATNPNTGSEIQSGGLASYQRTVHSTKDLTRALRRYLLEHGLKPDPDRFEIAILTEFTTTYGQGFLQKVNTPSTNSLLHSRARRQKAAGDDSVDRLVLPFPLYISWLLGEGDEVTGRSPKGEKPPSEDETVATTLARSSARLALAQLLSTISLEEIRYVGIVATDVRDKLFLARQVRQFCPDVRLFTFESDILLADPGQADILRGTLVVSTYPLFNKNQVWTFNENQAGPMDGTELPRRRIQFPSEAAQGIYNATLFLLDDREESRLLEYRMPLLAAPRSPGAVGPLAPPVWISVVGNGALWPLDAREAGEGDPFLRRVAAQSSERPPRPNDLSIACHFLVMVLLSFSLLSSLWYFFGPTPSTFARVRLPLATMADPASPFVSTQFVFFAFHLLIFGLLLFGIRLFGPAPGSPIWSLFRLFLEKGHRLYAFLFLVAGLFGIAAVVTAGSMLVRALSGSTGPLFGAAPKARHVFTAILAGVAIAALVNQVLRGAPGDLEHLLFRERAAHLSSGVSPLLPVCCLSVFFFLALLGQLSFRAAYESFEATPAGGSASEVYLAASSTAFATSLFGDLLGVGERPKGGLARTWEKFASSHLGGPVAAFLGNWRSPLVLLQITCFAAATIGAVYFYFEFLPTFESREGLDGVLRFSFVVPPVLMVFLLIDVLARWTSLRETLASFAGDPVFSAETADGPNPFTRFLPRRGKPFFADVPRLFEIEQAVRKLRSLPGHGPARRPLSTPDERSDARRRRLYDELLTGVRPFLDRTEPRTPETDDVVRAAAVYMLRVKFTCLRRRLLIPLFGMPLLILALASYPFEPQRLLMLPLSAILLVFVCATLVLFVDMERNYVVSHVSGTPAGKVTLNGEFILKLVVFTVPALFALAGSKVPRGGNVFFSWVQDLLNVLK